MSVDREFKIRITGDSSEATAATGSARKGVEELTGAQAEHTKHLLHGTSAGKGFHRLLHELMVISPELGYALNMAISPVGGAFLAAMAAVKLFHDHLEKVNEALDKMGEEASHGMGNMTAAMIAAREEVAKIKREYDQFIEGLTTDNSASKTDLDTVIARLQALHQAAGEKADAEKALHLAQIESNPALSPEQKIIAKNQLEEQYEAQKRQRDKANRDAEFAEEKATVEQQAVWLKKKEDELADAEAKKTDEKARAKLINDEAKVKLLNKSIGFEEYDETSENAGRRKLTPALEKAQADYDAAKAIQDSASAAVVAPGELPPALPDLSPLKEALDKAKEDLKKYDDEIKERHQLIDEVKKEKDSFSALDETIKNLESTIKDLNAGVKSGTQKVGTAFDINSIKNQSEAEVGAINAQKNAIKEWEDVGKTPGGKAYEDAWNAEHKAPSQRTAEDNRRIEVERQVLLNQGLPKQMVDSILEGMRGMAANYQEAMREMAIINQKIAAAHNHPH